MELVPVHTNRRTRDERNKESEKRQRKMERKRRQRLYDFDADTLFIKFVWPSKIGEYTELYRTLRPHLENPSVKAIEACRFDFPFDTCSKKCAYAELARFLYGGLKRGVFRKSISTLLRYLSSPEHSNLGVGFSTLKARLAEWREQGY